MLSLLDASTLQAHLTANDDWTLQKLLDRINTRRAQHGLPALTRAELGDAVTTVLEPDTVRLTQPRRRIFTQQLGVVLVPLFLLVAAFHACVPWPRRQTLMQPTVISWANLPPYHLIGPKDVEMAERPVDPLALTSADLAIGRHVTRALARGEVLHAADLKRADRMADLNTRHIVMIPIRHVDAALAAALPAVVTLVFSDAKGAPVAEERSVYLLATVREPQQAFSTGTVAVSADALVRIAPLLSGRDITVSWDAPRQTP